MDDYQGFGDSHCKLCGEHDTSAPCPTEKAMATLSDAIETDRRDRAEQA